MIKNRMPTVYFEKENITSEKPVILNSYTMTNNKSFILKPTCSGAPHAPPVKCYWSFPIPTPAGLDFWPTKLIQPVA
jgi:hypothetical protein